MAGPSTVLVSATPGTNPNAQSMVGYMATGQVFAPGYVGYQIETNTVQTPALDGTDASGVTAPTGGVGIRGWLSGIYNALVNTVLKVADQNGAAFSSAVVLTAGGAADSAGRSVEMLVTVAGNVSFQLAGGSAHVISVAASPYTQTFPYSITAINSSGTTATATYANLH